MFKFNKVPVNAINEMLLAEQGEQSNEQFVSTYLQSVRLSLLIEPLLYRSFGAYWWTLKRLMISMDDYNNEFGEYFDEYIDKALSYDNDAQTVCAIFLEQDDVIQSGLMKSTIHSFDTLDEKSVDIDIEDDIMEKLHLINQIS